MSIHAEDFTILVGRDSAAGEYVAVLREFPSLSWVADTKVEAAAGLIRMLDEVLTDMAASGEPIPEPSAPHLIPA